MLSLYLFLLQMAQYGFLQPSNLQKVMREQILMFRSGLLQAPSTGLFQIKIFAHPAQ